MASSLLRPLLAYISKYPALVFEELLNDVSNCLPNTCVVGGYFSQLAGFASPHKPEHKGVGSSSKAWKISRGLRKVHYVLLAGLCRELFPVVGTI